MRHKVRIQITAEHKRPLSWAMSHHCTTPLFTYLEILMTVDQTYLFCTNIQRIKGRSVWYITHIHTIPIHTLYSYYVRLLICHGYQFCIFSPFGLWIQRGGLSGMESWQVGFGMKWNWIVIERWDMPNNLHFIYIWLFNEEIEGFHLIHCEFGSDFLQTVHLDSLFPWHSGLL